jgi:hypothetical protein
MKSELHRQLLKTLVDTGQILVDVKDGLVYWSKQTDKPATSYTTKGHANISVPRGDGGTTTIEVSQFIAYAMWGDKVLGKEFEIGHVNGDRSDNRGCNLMLVPRHLPTPRPHVRRGWYEVENDGETIAYLRNPSDASHFEGKLRIRELI